MIMVRDRHDRQDRQDRQNWHSNLTFQVTCVCRAAFAILAFLRCWSFCLFFLHIFGFVSFVYVYCVRQVHFVSTFPPIFIFLFNFQTLELTICLKKSRNKDFECCNKHSYKVQVKSKVQHPPKWEYPKSCPSFWLILRIFHLINSISRPNDRLLP